MIVSFGNKLAEDLFHNRTSKHTRHFQPDLYKTARRKLYLLHYLVNLSELKAPPGNQLEPLKGHLKGYYSIRVNKQWRLVFQWDGQNIIDVAVMDYH